MEEELNDNVDVGKTSRNQSETSKNGIIQNEKVKKKADMNEAQCCYCKKNHIMLETTTLAKTMVMTNVWLNLLMLVAVLLKRSS